MHADNAVQVACAGVDDSVPRMLIHQYDANLTLTLSSICIPKRSVVGIAGSDAIRVDVIICTEFLSRVAPPFFRSDR